MSPMGSEHLLYAGPHARHWGITVGETDKTCRQAVRTVVGHQENK